MIITNLLQLNQYYDSSCYYHQFTYLNTRNFNIQLILKLTQTKNLSRIWRESNKNWIEKDILQFLFHEYDTCECPGGCWKKQQHNNNIFCHF